VWKAVAFAKETHCFIRYERFFFPAIASENSLEMDDDDLREGPPWVNRVLSSALQPRPPFTLKADIRVRPQYLRLMANRRHLAGGYPITTWRESSVATAARARWDVRFSP
jgi:hypothetical protein